MAKTQIKAKAKHRARPVVRKSAGVRSNVRSNVLPIVLDRETMAWLVELSRSTDNHPGVIASHILRDVREDDQAAHASTH
jgi:hypothetical protein